MKARWKQLWKRSLALTLALSMALSLCLTTSLAAEDSVEGQQEERNDYVYMLNCTEEVHVHDTNCYAILCGEEENPNHIHGQACYDPAPTCGMAEHVHTLVCFEPSEEPYPYEEVKDAVTPTLVYCDQEGHTHSFLCQVPYEAVTVETDGEDAGQPAEDESGEDADQPAEDESGEDADQPAEDEGGEDTNEPAEDEGGEDVNEPAEDEGGEDANEPAEDEGGEDANEPAEDEGGEDANEPAEGEDGEDTNEPAEDEGGEDANEPAEGEDGEDTNEPAEDEGGEDANEPTDGEGGAVEIPDEDIPLIAFPTISYNYCVHAEDESVHIHGRDCEPVEIWVAVGEDVNMTALTFPKTPIAKIGDVEYPMLSLAVKKAVAGDTITFVADINESVTVSEDITIDLDGHTWTGRNDTTLIVTGKNASSAVTVKNGTIVAGEAASSAKATAIYANNADLTIENCQISGNGTGTLVRAETASAKTHANEVLTISGSSFENALIGVYAAAEGNIKERSMTANISDSTFKSNARGLKLSVNNSGSKPKFDVAVTGCTFEENTNAGIDIANNANNVDNFVVNVADSKFLNNTGSALKMASFSDCATVNITGGEISGNQVSYSSDSVIKVNGPFTMDGTTVSNNKAYLLMDLQKTTSVSIKNAAISDNEATVSSDSRGAIYVAGNSNAVVDVANSTFTGNTGRMGGALYVSGTNAKVNIDGSTFSGNTAKASGGALYLNATGGITIHDTIITDNTANNVVSKTMGYGYIGGGLYVANTTGTVTLSGTTRVYNNHTPGDKLVPGTNDGGSADIALASSKVTSSATAKNPNNFTRAELVLDGETSFVGEDGNLYTLTQFDRTTVNKNGYYWISGSNYYWPMGYYTMKKEPARVYLGTAGQHTGENVVMTTTLADAVAEAQANGLDTIYVCNNTTVDMASAVSLNSGIKFVRCEDHPNGHMFTINGTVTLDNAHIDGMNVESDSSMIYVPSSGALTIAGDTVIENGRNAASKGNGGAIYVSQGSMAMTGGTITSNTAYQGGGIYAMGGTLVSFDGGTVSKNTATGGNGGGGAYIEATSSEFGVKGGRTLFDSNVSAQLGGGVFLVNGVNANTHHYIYKATFTNNQSNRPSGGYFDGGAIYIQSGTTAHMKNVYVSGGQDSDKANNGYTAVAVCPSGELAVYELEGLLAVNNGKNPDIGVIAAGVMPSTDPKVYLPSNAPGGGEVTYRFKDGTVVDTSDYQFIEGYFRLFTVASESAIAAARTTAAADGVVIENNYANQYGSGIMTNGLLKIGTETKSLKVVKNWADGNENHDEDQILVYLTMDGKIVPADFRSDSSVVLNKDNNWSYTWTNLGNEFEWGVKEASVGGYASEVKIEKDTEFSAIADKYYIATVTNTQDGSDPNKLAITKHAYGLDPDASYQFTLKLNNVGDEVFALQLDGTMYPIYNNEITFYLKDGQSAVVDGLPDGFTYEVAEAKSSEYQSYQYESVTANLGGAGSIYSVEVVNMLGTEVVVQKVWNDNDDYMGRRPVSIKVHLMNGGVEMGEVTLSEENGWTHTFADLPMFDAEGKVIPYTVEEEPVDFYTPEYSGLTIINNYNTVDLTVAKDVVVPEGVVVPEDEKPLEIPFQFTVELRTPDGELYAGVTDKDEVDPMGVLEFSYELYTGNEKTEGSLNFNNGIAEFALQHNQRIVIKGLPVGLTAVVTEKEDNRFWTMVEQNGEADSKVISNTVGVLTESGENQSVTFTNTRIVPTDDAITGAKSLTGRDFQKGDHFTFAIEACSEASDNPNVMPQSKTEKTLPEKKLVTVYPGMTAEEVAELDESETSTLVSGEAFKFALHFTEPGTYHYVINEKRPEGGEAEFSGIPGVTYDPMQYHVIVEVKHEGDSGELTSKVTTVWARNTNARGFWPDENLLGADGEPMVVFNNTYNPDEVTRFFLVKKFLSNKELGAGEFQFVLEPKGSAAWDAEKMNPEDTQTFESVEYTKDAMQPLPTVIYGEEETGAAIEADENGNIVVGNGPSGHVTFDGIKFTETHAGANYLTGKVYKYTIREQQPTEDGTMDGEALEGAVKNADGQWVYQGITYSDKEVNLYIHVSVQKTVDGSIIRAQVYGEREAWFYNDYSGSLTVSKTVTGTAGDQTKDWGFTVTLTDKNENSLDVVNNTDVETEDGDAIGLYELPYVLKDAAGEETTGTLALVNDELKFTLKHGESITISNLPEGVKYTVTEDEANADGYETTSTDNTNGSIANGDTVTVAFTNHKDIENGSLTLRKTVTGSRGDKTRDWVFYITLAVPDGKELPESIRNIPNLTAGEEPGSYTATLKDGESMTIADLPAGTRYIVTETGADGYITTVNGAVTASANGEIAADEDAETSFTNHYPDPGLTVIKVWSGDTEEMRPESITVQLLRDGEPYGDPVTLNAGNQWTYTWTELSEEYTWTVAEIDVPEGYTVAYSTAENDDSTVVTITNTRPDNPPPPDNPNTPDNPDNPPPPDNPDNPTPPDDDDRTTTEDNPPPETPETPENPEEPSTVIEEPPVPMTQLPDPNDPESPEVVTILEDDVPKTYIKVQDPETEEFLYIPEDEVPLFGFDIPETGDKSATSLWAMLSVASLIGVTTLVATKPRKKEEE